MKLPDTNVMLLGGLGLGALWFLSGRSRDPLLPDNLPPPPMTVRPTMTRQAARVMADLVFAAIYGDGGWFSGQTAEDEAAVIRAMEQPRNDADVALCIDEYGVRSGRWSLSGDLDLVGAVNEYLSASDVVAINNGFRARGISFRF